MSTPPITPVVQQKHPLDKLDVFAKVGIGLASLVIALASSYWAVRLARESNRLQLTKTAEERQRAIEAADNQVKEFDLRRELAEKQWAVNLMPSFKCEYSSIQSVPFLYLQQVAPAEARKIYTSIAQCSPDPKVRERGKKLLENNSEKQAEQDFLNQLETARTYRQFGVQNQAAEEYEKAYNMHPEVFRLSRGLADMARAKLASRDYQAASDLYEQLFTGIEARR